MEMEDERTPDSRNDRRWKRGKIPKPQQCGSASEHLHDNDSSLCQNRREDTDQAWNRGNPIRGQRSEQGAALRVCSFSFFQSSLFFPCKAHKPRKGFSLEHIHPPETSSIINTLHPPLSVLIFS